jgi:hypothetical protein
MKPSKISELFPTTTSFPKPKTHPLFETLRLVALVRVNKLVGDVNVRTSESLNVAEPVGTETVFTKQCLIECSERVFCLSR